MSENSEEQLKRRLNELEQRINATSYLMFSYIQAILALLNAKEFATPEEFEEFLGKCRQELAKKMQDAQFMETMKDFLPKDKKE